MATKNTYLWVIGVIALVIIWQAGWLSNLGIGTNTNANTNAANTQLTTVAPSDGESTITLNTKDSLSPTDKNANVSYYVFRDSDGAFVKSGTTAAGTASFTVNYGKSYKLLAFSDSTFYPVETNFLADEDGAQKTINVGLMPVSNITVNKMRDPVDLDGNITAVLGGQVNFDMLYSVASSSSATYKPVIVCDVNQTSVTDVAIGSLSKVACPTRLTTGNQRKKLCFQDETIKSADGIRTRAGSILFSSSTTPASPDYIHCYVVDTQAYADPNYVVKGISAFHEGTENINDLSNVGAADGQSAAATEHANTYAYLYFT